MSSQDTDRSRNSSSGWIWGMLLGGMAVVATLNDEAVVETYSTDVGGRDINVEYRVEQEGFEPTDVAIVDDYSDDISIETIQYDDDALQEIQVAVRDDTVRYDVVKDTNFFSTCLNEYTLDEL